jgi:transposase-like protein
MRKEIHRLWKEGISGEGSVLDELLSSGARLVLQELLEQEVSEFLGRGHYERRGDGQPHRGYRSGYEPGRVRTAEG